MNNKETVRRIIASAFGHLSQAEIDTLAARERDISHANMQLGLNAQAAANRAQSEAVASIVDGLQPHYLDQIARYCLGGALTLPDQRDNLRTVWDTLEDYRERCLQEEEERDAGQWDDLCTAMAQLREALGLPSEVEDHEEGRT